MKWLRSTELLRVARKLLCGFRRSEDGNVMVIFGLAIVPIFLFAGAALDFTRALDARTTVQAIADSASLAATKELMKDKMTPAKAEALALKLFNAQIAASDIAGKLLKLKPVASAIKTKNSDGTTTARVTVDATADVDLVLVPAVGALSSFNIGTHSVSESRLQPTALSMYLVLDRSGSMGGGKIQSLKKAVKQLLDVLKKADPQKKYARVGGAAYNTNVAVSQALVWGVGSTKNFLNKFSAGGGTNTAAGTALGVGALSSAQEKKEHNKKNRQDPKKFMLVMTDGQNNQPIWDTDTISDCTKAKNAGIEVYTVAFQAPSTGKQLLQKCATDASHYFDATNSAALVAAFKKIGEEAAKSIPRVKS